MSERGQSKKEFRQRLQKWFSEVARDLPWRRSDDPYRVWVSEIMLQQTRVDQAMPYYERFVSAYPDVSELAKADLDEVLLNWEGLGYYSRARNLHRAAQMVVRDHGGQIPTSYEGLRGLPGIGDYTASAVGSIVFGIPQAVLDGNVVRVLARFDALAADVGSSQTRSLLRERAQDLLDPDRPGEHNEALMELGAMVCTPKQPDCPHCPVARGCAARTEGSPERYPVKKPRKPVPEFEIAVGVVWNAQDQVLIQRRPADGLLGGLWEFPGGKCHEGEAPSEACSREIREELGIEVSVHEGFPIIRHAYSHFRIRLHAFSCRMVSGTPVSASNEPWKWVSQADLDAYAFPRANRRLIEALAANGAG
ncbi:MAG: A/G-specific adenine glycosylase [Rhodothermales bacterium]